MAESPVAKERDLRDGMRFGCESTIRTMAKNSSNFLRGSRTGFLRGSRTGPKTLSRQAEFSLCAAPAYRPEHTYGRAGAAYTYAPPIQCLRRREIRSRRGPFEKRAAATGALDSRSGFRYNGCIHTGRA